MKTRYFKKIFASALMVTAILGTSSCINDLDISPIDPQYACLLYTSDAADE